MLFDYGARVPGRERASGRVALSLLLICLCCLVSPPAPAFEPEPDAKAIQLNNLGVAYMNQQLLDKALTFFMQAVKQDPALAVPHVNAGIALMTAQRLDEARVQLGLATQADPHNARAWYNLGLLDREQNRSEAMRQDFAAVLRDDARNADAHYYLGADLSERKEYTAAIVEFRAALTLVPLHASAEFGLARALQHSGDAAGAREHLERFQHITREKLSAPLATTYGEQGLDSLTVEMRPAQAAVGPMIPVTFSAFALPGLAFARPGSAATQGSGGICQIDMSGHGEQDFIVLTPAAPGGAPSPTYLRQGLTGAYTAVSARKLGISLPAPAVACAVGDFDNDGHPDLALALSDQVLLYRNRGDGTFTDVTTQAAIKPLNQPTALTFVDFDHDGDLDLLVTGSAKSDGSSDVLWRNNGNLTFTEWTAPTGLAGSASGTQGAVLSDLNNDRAVDLIVTGAAGTQLYLNQREGSFLNVPLYAERSLPAARGASVLDFNKDGLMDVAVTHAGAPGLTIWKNLDGRHFERVALPMVGVKGAWGVTPIDFDNDGWIDLAVVVETEEGTELRVLRNLGPAGFEDVSEQLQLKGVPLKQARGIIATDVDGDGAADLLVSRTDGMPWLLRNAGGSRNHSQRIVLHGLADNKTALGTKVEVFAGGNWQKFEIAGGSGYLSQGGATVLAGLGSNAQPEIVRLLWPTGVPQDELPAPHTDLASEQTPALELTELDRRGSSCPVVFAWDGSRYAFITDTIGAAVVGHWFTPTRRNTPDPDEWIKIDGVQLQPKHGLLSLRMGEPMEEVNYIDQVRLLAVDHPGGTLVYPDESFRNQAPFATGRPVLTHHAHPARAAWDDSGRSVTTLLSTADHHFVQDFTPAHYDGFANLHHLTLDLGAWSPRLPLELLMTGYVEYFSASSLYAASQARLAPISPYVEAQGADGRWSRVVDDIGFPAGLERTMVVDLTGRLPAGTRRIRLGTNLQIYWDRILIANEAQAAAEVRQTELPLTSASLAFRGYPKEVDGSTPGDLAYDYQTVSATGPFVRASGLYTRLGDVTTLLRGVDDQFAIFGSGEDLDLEFSPAALPALPQGWQRDYFYYANGYVKDMDFYEAMPATVADLPFHGMSTYPYPAAEHFPSTPASVAYQLDWNDRTDDNNPRRDNSFHFVPRTGPASPVVRAQE